MSNTNLTDISLIRSVEDLTTAIGSGSSFKYIYFWSHKGTGVGSHCLSQWYPSKFHVNNSLFYTAEHYMMYRKAILFSDKNAAAQIIEAKDPGKAKHLGREIRNFDEEIWAANRFEIVVEGNVHKFRSNPELHSFLINTKLRVLVEASPRDRIWGIGMDKVSAQSQSPFKWKGLNLLGFALMEARSRLLATAA
ncbi:MAG: NADAR family protein [Leptolyngbya sp. SIO1E4]|nr:NADAR family protein [Leptolyngbya sp. SIO1E4]